jgi:hypothetical protein
VRLCVFFRSFLLTTKRNEPILRLSECKIKLVCFAEREQNQELKKSRRQGARVAKNWRFWFRQN